MAKSQTQVPSRQYAPGTRTVDIPSVTADDNGIQIVLTRESWTATGSNVLSGSIDGSNDGGATWFNLTVFSYPGGDQVNTRTGLPVTTCGPTVYWPESYTANGTPIPHRPQAVRAVITNTVSLRTAITLQGV